MPSVPPNAPASLTPVAFAAGMAYVVLRDVLPPITEVRHNKDQASLMDLRHAEMFGGTLVVLGGLGISSVTRNGVAFWAALLTGGVVLGFYEYALRG